MKPIPILVALVAATSLPSQAASTNYTNPLNTYSGSSQDNNNGAAQPVFLAGNPLADPVIPPSGLEVSFLANGFAPAAAWETVYFNDTSAVAPQFPGAKFGQNNTGGNGRNYVRTVATDYNTQDFTAYITVRRPAPTDGTNRRSVFFGLGTGQRSGANNPDSGTTNASAYVELQNGFPNAARRVQSDSQANVELAYNQMNTVSDNSIRIRMQWNSTTTALTYSFDYGYVPGDPFTADQTLPVMTPASKNFFTAQAAEWADGDRASIFFGGDRSVVFTDLVIEVSPQAIPPAPTALAVAAVADQEVNLTWSAIAPVGNTFSVYRSTVDGVFNDPAIATGLTEKLYQDTAVVNGTTYFYRVTQTNPNATTPESAVSNQVSATPVAGAVTPEGIVAANSGAGVISIDWSDLLAPFDIYKLYRSALPEGPFTLLSETGIDSNYRDETATAGTTFYYRVTSTKGVGESVPSTVVSATSGAIEIFADFNAGTVNSGRGVLGAGPGLTWNNDTGDSVASDKLNDSNGVITAIGLDGGSNFGVFPAATGAHVGGNPATLDAANGFDLMTDYRFTDGSTRTYTFSGLVPNRTYDLYLFGYGGGVDQNSAFNVGGIIKQNTDPTGLTTLTEGNHYLTYTAVAEVDGTLSFVWGTPGKLGLTDVQSAGGAGFSGFQLVENASALLQPTDLAATSDLTTQVELIWTAVDEAESYEIFRSTTSSTGFTLLGTSASNTYDDATATPGVTYFYAVKAVDTTPVLRKSFISAEVSGLKAPLIVDADSDGLSDSDEALIGTDPNDPADFFVAKTSSVTPNGGNYDISFVINGAQGDYVIERSTTLAEGSWTPVGTPVTWTWTTGVLDNLNLSTTGVAPAPGGKEFFRAKGIAPLAAP